MAFYKTDRKLQIRQKLGGSIGGSVDHLPNFGNHRLVTPEQVSSAEIESVEVDQACLSP